jgi:hypothetical protein
MAGLNHSLKNDLLMTANNPLTGQLLSNASQSMVYQLKGKR